MMIDVVVEFVESCGWSVVQVFDVKRGGVCDWVEFDGVDPLFFDKLKLHVDCYLANKVW